jgi:hypothetical protein
VQPAIVLQVGTDSWVYREPYVFTDPVRALDPIIARLLEASDGTRVHASKSQPDLDFSWLAYLVESVITLLRFGGQGLSKACQTTDLSKSSHPTILQHTNGTFFRFSSCCSSLLSQTLATLSPTSIFWYIS